eukprot:TRINITY_DN28554_c0_g1_i1.p1 TRINITY_DN28554_c0_g1~~TRINITY_DN28554_c0_g1_i1.p1  ORF type:complete len:382 (+),score=83.62 TRINITY_DN28554_c0_g1_i1:127-1272(+)
MPKTGLSTKEFVQKLCDQLGHAEGAAPCVKKLVNDHWLHDFDDLRRVPRQRFERWGFPLKLIDEVCEALLDADTNAAVSSMQAYVNYSLKPSLAWFSGASILDSLRSDAARRRDPEEWAAKKLQHAFRRWQRRKEQAANESFMLAIAESIDENEVCRLQGAQHEEVRRKRAEEKLRRMVRRWKLRKARGQSSSTEFQADSIKHLLASCSSGAGSLVVATSARETHGSLRECEVTELLRRFAWKMNRPWDEILPYAHRLVTFNWLESFEDLAIVEDRHWDEWDVPERLVVMVKVEIESATKPGYQQALISGLTGTATCCCLGDCCGAFMDWFGAYRYYSQENDQQRAREEDRQKYAETKDEHAERQIAAASSDQNVSSEGLR